MAFLDNFTGVDGTLLTDHTSDSGHGWINFSGTAQLYQNKMWTATNPGRFQADWIPASADYDVEAQCVRMSSGGQGCYVMGRYTDNNNRYWAGWSGSAWIIGKSDGGIVNGSLATGVSAAPSIGVPFTIKLEMRGTVITLYMNGVEECTVDDVGGVDGPGFAGASMGGSSTTGGFHMDWITATDAGSSGGGGDDILIKDEFGYDTTEPLFYAGQPEGYRSLRLTLPAGTSYATSTFALSGDLAAYFSIQEINGIVWAVCNSTRMPDALDGGGRSLNIEQTDPGLTSSPHTTNFLCVVVSSEGRDTTGIMGLIPTQSWLYRRIVLDVYDMRWAGYEGQAFDTDIQVTSAAELDAAMAAIADGRTVWDRIRVANGSGGTYTGLFTDYVAYGEGGGLLIEPEAGHDPEINIEFNNIRWHGVHFRNLRCPGVGVGFYQFRFTSPDATGINGTGKFTKVKFTGNKFGLLWSPGQTVADVLAAETTVFLGQHGDNIEVSGNQFYGVSNGCFGSSGVRTSINEDNDYRVIMGDIYNPNNAANYYSIQDVLTDNHVYCVSRRNTVRDEYDEPGWSNGGHPDTWQIGAFEGNILMWSNGATITAGARRLNMKASTPAIYECTTGGVTDAAGTGPLRTTQGETGIVDGTVEWTHIADYTTASNLYGLYEENTMNSNSELSDEGTNRQSFIDSNGGKNCPAYMVIVNNAFGTESQYGIRGAGGNGYIGAHFNTLARPSITSGGAAPIDSLIYSNSDDQTIIATYNVVQNNTNISGANGRLLVYGEVVVDWSSTAADPDRPGDVMTGPFGQITAAGDKWGYPSLAFDGTAADFKADMRAILATLDGVAGIQVESSGGGGGNPTVARKRRRVGFLGAVGLM